MNKYECQECGFKVELSSLDDNYICQTCGASYLKFKKLEEVVEDKKIPISEKNPAIQRITEKCTNCGNCKRTCVNIVGIDYDINKVKEPICVNCGQCRITCPTGAICEKYEMFEVMKEIKNPNKIVVATTSPAVRVALGEEFENAVGLNVEGKMVASLKELGFNYVFDTTFGADLTTIEEANELANRIDKGKNLPMFTSCCPAWVKYVSMYHPNLLDHLSTCKSPIGMMGAVIKNYFANQININKNNIVVVAITPCTAKKYEKTNDDNVDYVITTSELALLIKNNNINFKKLHNEPFDEIMDKGSGGGIIFGSTGGVCESALRTLYNILTKKDLEKDKIDFKNIRGHESYKEASITINSSTYKVLVVFGLKEAEKILEKLENNEKVEYDFIEVMNCPGGCVGGGGQPLNTISKTTDISKLRSEGLYKEDKKSKIRLSYKNPNIISLYTKYLGCPLSQKSKELLHTKHKDNSNLLN